MNEEENKIDKTENNEINKNDDNEVNEVNDNKENGGNDEQKKVVIEHIYDSNNFRRRFISLVLVVAVGFIGFFCGTLNERVKSNNINSLKLEKIQQLIDKNYYFTDLIDHDKAFDNALSMYVASFGDQFTYYLDEDYLTQFNESITGNYVGIGVTVTTDEDGYVVITQCFKGGSAYEKGIAPGDKIVKVDEENVVGLSVDDIVAKIKGQEGKNVNITVLRDEKEQTFELTRKAVHVETVSSKMLDDSIGYINISSFDTETDKEFKTEYEKIAKNDLKGLIIDLRNNGGGLLDTVVNVADYLMPESTIVTIKYRNEKDAVYKSDKECADVPIVVLINEYTASAAELLAGGLRVNNNAKLVGKKSYGKGVVGTQFNIDSKTAMVITVGEYFLPDRTNIPKKGIVPDIEVELNKNIKNIYHMSETEDNQLQQAIEELKK